MNVPRSIRIFFLVVAELARKYTRSLFLGFFVGLVLAYIFWNAYPLIFNSFIRPGVRIGMVGEFSPSNLPLPIQEQISLGLTALSPDGSAVPALADHWEATNSGKTLIFTLKDTQKWHNGKTVTAHDINYNIRGVTLIPTGDTTLIAYLQYPYSPFSTLVSKPIFLPGLNGMGNSTVGKIHLIGGNVKSIQLQPVGSGSSGSKNYTFYQTEAQASLAFQLGEVDELHDLSTASALVRWGNIRVEERTKFDRVVALFFNMRNDLLSEKSVRHALAYGVPELPFVQADSPISSTSWAYTSNVKNFTYNPTEAKKLLKNTSLATSSANLTLSTFPAYLDIAQQIAASWTGLGIQTEVKVESSLPADYQVLLSAQDLPPDPDQYPFWHSTQNQTNITGYINVKIDKLLEDGRQEFDQTKRKAIYADFQRRLVEEAPAVFLYYPTLYDVIRGK